MSDIPLFNVGSSIIRARYWQTVCNSILHWLSQTMTSCSLTINRYSNLPLVKTNSAFTIMSTATVTLRRVINTKHRPTHTTTRDMFYESTQTLDSRIPYCVCKSITIQLREISTCTLLLLPARDGKLNLGLLETVWVHGGIKVSCPDKRIRPWDARLCGGCAASGRSPEVYETKTCVDSRGASEDRLNSPVNGTMKNQEECVARARRPDSWKCCKGFPQ